MDTLTSQARPQARAVRPRAALKVAWVGEPFWLDSPGAREELEDVELMFPSDRRRSRELLSGIASPPDVFHLSQSLLDDVGILRAIAPSAAVVVDCTDGGPKGWRRKRAIARQRAGADLILVGSPLELREARRRQPQYADRTAALPRPLDLDRFEEAAAHGRAAVASASNGRVNGQPLVLFAGPFTRAGGLGLALEAFARLGPQSSAATLAALCHGDCDRRYLGRLSTAAAARGLTPLVVDRPGEEELSSWIGAADVVCILSADPGAGRLANMAAAARKPVIAGELEPLLERVVDGHTGVLVPDGDHVALAEALGSLLENDTERERLGSFARERIEEEFAPDRVAARLRRYWEVARQRRRGGDHVGQS
ncbi:MAG TPA: glycosyltransferase family 4 protein [Gaiellaceae bacterium]|nr:glycosyltransferase family 4 protein [Gaiellaceae bacterium]